MIAINTVVVIVGRKRKSRTHFALFPRTVFRDTPTAIPITQSQQPDTRLAVYDRGKTDDDSSFAKVLFS